MENKFNNGLIIILATFLTVMFVNYNSLKSDVSLLENSLSNEITRLEQQIGAIYQNVDDQLKEQSSLLTYKQHEFLEMDSSNKKVNVKFSVVPKTIIAGTNINITLGKNTFEMKREDNGKYTAIVPVDLFGKEDNVPLVTIKSNNEMKTEYLEEHSMSNIWTQYLPTIRGRLKPEHAKLSGDKLTVNGQLEIGCDPSVNDRNIKFSKYDLKVEIDGKELVVKDITNLVQNDEINVSFDEEYNIGNGKDFAIYVKAEDSLGYIHERLAFHWQRPADDPFRAREEAVAVRYVGETIYDKDGTVLYSKMDW